MPPIARTFSLLLIATTLAACSSAPQSTARSTPLLYVPSAMLAQSTNPATNRLALDPYQILPASDADTLFVGRPEKFAYGQTVYAESTAYSIYTYDQQLISNLWGPSYRYRWISQNGITSP